MTRRRAVDTAVPVSVQRRSALVFLGFRYDCRAALWCRGALSLSDEALDRMHPRAFAQRVRHWRRAARRPVGHM
jgi:hypothetical protein